MMDNGKALIFIISSLIIANIEMQWGRICLIKWSKCFEILINKINLNKLMIIKFIVLKILSMQRKFCSSRRCHSCNLVLYFMSHLPLVNHWKTQGRPFHFLRSQFSSSKWEWHGLLPMSMCGLNEIINGKASMNNQIPYTCQVLFVTPMGR